MGFFPLSRHVVWNVIMFWIPHLQAMTDAGLMPYALPWGGFPHMNVPFVLIFGT